MHTTLRQPEHTALRQRELIKIKVFKANETSILRTLYPTQKNLLKPDYNHRSYVIRKLSSFIGRDSVLVKVKLRSNGEVNRFEKEVPIMDYLNVMNEWIHRKKGEFVLSLKSRELSLFEKLDMFPEQRLIEDTISAIKGIKANRNLQSLDRRSASTPQKGGNDVISSHQLLQKLLNNLDSLLRYCSEKRGKLSQQITITLEQEGLSGSSRRARRRRGAPSVSQASPLSNSTISQGSSPSSLSSSPSSASSSRSITPQTNGVSILCPPEVNDLLLFAERSSRPSSSTSGSTSRSLTPELLLSAAEAISPSSALAKLRLLPSADPCDKVSPLKLSPNDRRDLPMPGSSSRSLFGRSSQHSAPTGVKRERVAQHEAGEPSKRRKEDNARSNSR